MSPFGKFIRIVAILALAGAIGILFGWLASRQGNVQPIDVPPMTNMVSLIPPAPPPETNWDTATTSHSSVADAAGDDAGQTDPDWEQKLEDILLSSDDDNAKADHILALIPNAPPDAQVELAQHLVNMVQDDHYGDAAQLLTNSATPEAVSTVLMNDLLNRGNDLKLPMLLAVAREDDNPLKDQAREMLELLIQEDDGTNWDQWAAAISTWLQNNPQ